MRVSLFRVEDAAQVGPYTDEAADLGIECGETDYRIHARNDNLMPTDPREIFVFRSIDLLRNWFSTDARALELAGYNIVKIEADSGKIRDGLSGRQSLYLDDESSIRQILPYREIFGKSVWE